MQLRRRKRTMQQWRDNLECELPLVPEGAEEVEDYERFADCAEEGGDGGEEEEAGEEEVAGWEGPVEDYGDVGEEFADYVECSYYPRPLAESLNLHKDDPSVSALPPYIDIQRV
jgi:hypothetical protein